MDKGPLVREEIDAGAKLVRALAPSWPVAVAFWLKASDDEFRYLYLASERINEAGSLEGYRIVLQRLRELQATDPDFEFDPFRIKVVETDEPLAKAAIDMNTRFPPGRHGTRLSGQRFGDRFIDDVYIYPPLAAPVT
jgi:hypothetical protein